VLAHELGHHARRHVTQGLVLQGALVLGALWVADRALRAGTRALGLAGPEDPAGLPFLALVVTALGLLAPPPLAPWSRRLEGRGRRCRPRRHRRPAGLGRRDGPAGPPQPGRATPGAAGRAALRDAPLPRGAHRGRARRESPARRRPLFRPSVRRALTPSRPPW